MSYLVRAFVLAAFLASGHAWAACNPPAATTGMVGCLPVLTSDQTTDVLMLWRPSLFPNSLNQITLANFLGSLPPGMPLSALGNGYINGQLLIGGTASGNLAAATLTAGSGIGIVNGTNSITISATGSPATSITVGTTAVLGGTTSRIFYDNAGVLGEYLLSGTGNVVMNTSPSISGLTVTGSFTATGLVTNADLVNSSMTIGGQSISLGGATTNQGNGGKLQLSTGTTTTDHCVKFDANGNTVDAGGTCGTGSGTVTAVSVATAHGFSGSSSGGTTPALTLNAAGCNGVCKSDATTLSTATPGTDYLAPTSNITECPNVEWSDGIAVAAETNTWIAPTAGTITALKGFATGGFTAELKIAGVDVTGCNAFAVSGATVQSATCTAPNTFSAFAKISITTSSVSGNGGSICPLWTRAAN